MPSPWHGPDCPANDSANVLIAHRRGRRGEGIGETYIPELTTKVGSRRTLPRGSQAQDRTPPPSAYIKYEVVTFSGTVRSDWGTALKILKELASRVRDSLMVMMDATFPQR